MTNFPYGNAAVFALRNRVQESRSAILEQENELRTAEMTIARAQRYIDQYLAVIKSCEDALARLGDA